MKVAILSLIPHNNYGGILQSFALQTYIESLGYEVDIISKRTENTSSFWKMAPRYLIRTIRKIAGKQRGPIMLEKYDSIISRNTIKFQNKHLHIHLIEQFSDLKPTDYDIYVVGSDQVWRPLYFEEQYRESIRNAYLGFTEGWKVKRLAYAASFGTDDWEYNNEDTIACKKLAGIFDSISVREEDGVKLCKKMFDVDAIQLCDPTLLLDRNNYEDIISEDIPCSEGNLLVYCLDKSANIDKMVDLIVTKYSYKPFYTNSPGGVDYSIEEQIKPSVETWLRGFIDAKYVITDSFHACVFSIIFHKPFVVIGNQKRGMSRFYSLLKTFGQERRLIFSPEEYSDDMDTISFDGADYIIENLRKKSFCFFNNMIDEKS